MNKIRIKPYRPVYPSPAALIISIDDKSNPNIITLGEVFNISIRKPVIVGIVIRPATYSHGLISKTKEYVINLPTAKIIELVDGCGTTSGHNKIDKFKIFRLTPVKADEISPPLIKECPVNIECKVIDIQRIGDHDLFFGEVLAVHVDEDKLDEYGNIIPNKLDMLIYITGEYWNAGKKLENLYYSKKLR